jgi:ElaA protein
MPASAPEFHRATFAELDARTLHDLLRLRVDVFVVEQHCPYPEIDGRDIEPTTRHLWLTRNHDCSGPARLAPRPDLEQSAPVAYLRILAEPGGVARIGRVVVAPDARGDGHAGRLMTEALALVGDQPCVLDAQSHLAGFYARYGFTATGPEFLDDGIPHVPMARPAHTSAGY